MGERKGHTDQIKRGVSFLEAQNAFLNPKRIIVEDEKHNLKEKRCYCFGKEENFVKLE